LHFYAELMYNYKLLGRKFIPQIRGDEKSND